VEEKNTYFFQERIANILVLWVRMFAGFLSNIPNQLRKVAFSDIAENSHLQDSAIPFQFNKV
jgi:hypothetical protein